MIGSSRVKLQRTGFGHDQEVAQVGMSCTVEMGMAEADYGLVVILVTGTVPVNRRIVFTVHVIRDGIGVGAELDEAKGDACPGKGMPHFAGADQWVHKRGEGLGCNDNDISQQK